MLLMWMIKKKFPLLTGPDVPVHLFVYCVAQPKSRGFLKLRSKNPWDTPIIDPQYLHDERDRKDYIEGYKKLERIATNPQFF